MDFNDYEQHIIKKCKLAISIAISRCKPQNVTIGEYLENLNKVNDEDLDAAVCIEDFDMDVNPTDPEVSVDSDTILRGFEDNVEAMNEFTANNNGMELDNEQLYKQTICESLDIVNSNNQYIDDDQTYCTQFEHPQNIGDEINKDIQIDEGKETNATFVDSQLTQIYTLYGLTQNDTHYSGTQIEYYPIPQKYIASKNVEIVKQDGTENDACINEVIDSKIAETNTDVMQSAHQNVVVNVNIEGSTPSLVENVDMEGSTQSILENVDFEGSKQNIVKNVHMEGSAQNIFENVHMADSTQNFLINVHMKGSAQNILENIDFEGIKQNIVKNVHMESSTQKIAKNLDMTGSTQNILENVHMEGSTQKIVKNVDMKGSAQNILDNVDFEGSTQNIVKNVHMTGSAQNILENENKDRSKNIVENINLEVTPEESRVIPFKVLEELSRIKSLLNRRNDEGFSDSGYRSSQLHYSGRSVQNSNTWINQSAYSLFNYIKNCPIIVATDEIANEISLVLGQLIDWLHKEECYPIFLQELLEYVDVLLKNINEPDNEQILKKDESIYRFILINRSVHMMRYTLDKLTDTLQDLQTKLTNKETCIEIDDIAATENISYVFHVLEILLDRYIQIKDAAGQSPQAPEACARKSTITDVWRKKWNHNCKESAVVGSCEKKCVLLKCGEVLNKIILEGIEKYSLVAYRALQCYNILQKT